jgi:hypothetical protein
MDAAETTQASHFHNNRFVAKNEKSATAKVTFDTDDHFCRYHLNIDPKGMTDTALRIEGCSVTRNVR